MPVDYSKFKDIEDSDEEPIWEHKGKKIKGLPQKKLDDLEAATQKLKGRRCYCFFDFATDVWALKKYEQELATEGVALPQQGNLGRVVVELDQIQYAPRLCENLRSLCTGERGEGVGKKKLHYKNRPLDLILPKYCLQVSIPNEYSCWGRYLEDEKLAIPSCSFDKPGLVAVGNHGPNTNTCTTMFLLNEASHLDGYNQIIGRVVQGMEVLRCIEWLPTNRKERAFAERNVKTHWGGKPMVDVIISNCGELQEDEVKLSPPADGDIYPESFMDCSCEKDHDTLFRAAEKIREIGNAYVKKKDYIKALEKYKKAQGYLAPLLNEQHVAQYPEEDVSTWMAGGYRPKDRTDIIRADLTIKLNVSQTLIYMQEFQAAMVVCDGVLLELVGKHSRKGHGALPNEMLTVKALYRRARARVGLSGMPGEVSQLEEAIEDLQRALTVEPENEDLKAELERVRMLQRQADVKSKEVYGSMLQPTENDSKT